MMMGSEISHVSVRACARTREREREKKKGEIRTLIGLPLGDGIAFLGSFRTL